MSENGNIGTEEKKSYNFKAKLEDRKRFLRMGKADLSDKALDSLAFDICATQRDEADLDISSAIYHIDGERIERIYEQIVELTEENEDLKEQIKQLRMFNKLLMEKIES